MKKYLIICTGILVLLFSISIIRVGQIFVTSYICEYAMWCNTEDIEYIQSHSDGEIDIEFNVAICKLIWEPDIKTIEVINDFPNISHESIELEQNKDKKYEDVYKYIKENNSKTEVFFRAGIIYIIVCFVCIIAWYVWILPKMTE